MGISYDNGGHVELSGFCSSLTLFGYFLQNAVIKRRCYSFTESAY